MACPVLSSAPWCSAVLAEFVTLILSRVLKFRSLIVSCTLKILYSLPAPKPGLKKKNAPMDLFSHTLAPFSTAEFDFQEAALSMSVSNAVGPPRFFLL